MSDFTPDRDPPARIEQEPLESELLPDPPASQRFSRSILWYEGLGFGMIIVLCWADELLHLPYLLFGGSSEFHWRASLLQTEVVALVWFVIHRHTSKVLRRLHYLEHMLRICAWCRKINDGESWVPIEQYFSTKFATPTSHGMCPDCAKSFHQKD